MSAPKLASYVTATSPTGEQVTLGPDSDLPDWALTAITNPAAWEGGEAPEQDTSKGDQPYPKWTKSELETEVARRNEGRADEDLVVVDAPGNKPELVAALEADDAAAATRGE